MDTRGKATPPHISLFLVLNEGESLRDIKERERDMIIFSLSFSYNNIYHYKINMLINNNDN